MNLKSFILDLFSNGFLDQKDPRIKKVIQRRYTSHEINCNISRQMADRDKNLPPRINCKALNLMRDNEAHRSISGRARERGVVSSVGDSLV